MNTKEAQKLRVIINKNGLTSNDIKQILNLKDFALNNDFPISGTNCHEKIYLSGNKTFEKNIPKILNKIITAMKNTDKNEWNLLSSKDINKNNINIRVIEYHHYYKNGGLFDNNHFDGGSILTCVCMLSNPNTDLDGGILMTKEVDGKLKKHLLNKGDIAVFPSHKYHCVGEITNGEREVLVIELWDGYRGTEMYRAGSFGHLLPY